MIETEMTQQNLLPINTVEAYPSASLNDDPFLYPGVRPEDSFLLANDSVYALESSRHEDTLDFSIRSANGASQRLDDFLLQREVPVMDERIPILGYGANMCPASIKSKFTKVGREDAQIVPTIYGQLKGYDVVWSGGPGVNGNFIANLYKGEETEGTVATIGVNFLTTEQLLVMHGTELSYDLTMVEVEIEGVAVRALLYAGVDDILIRDGKPVAVEAIHAEGRTIDTATTRTLLEDMLADKEVYDALELEGVAPESAEAEDYVLETKQLQGVPGAKLAKKRIVHAAMARLGRSRAYKLPITENSLQSWANPSTIPTFGEQRSGIHHKDVYRLPSQDLEHAKWADPTKRNLVLKSMGTHYMRMTGIPEVVNNDADTTDSKEKPA